MCVSIFLNDIIVSLAAYLLEWMFISQICRHSLNDSGSLKRVDRRVPVYNGAERESRGIYHVLLNNMWLTITFPYSPERLLLPQNQRSRLKDFYKYPNPKIEIGSLIHYTDTTYIVFHLLVWDSFKPQQTLKVSNNLQSLRIVTYYTFSNYNWRPSYNFNQINK